MPKLIKFVNKKQIDIIIKVHPVYQTYQADFSEHKIVMIKNNCKNSHFHITYNFDFSVLLSGADIIITDFSNVGIETILAGKPLITVNFSKQKFEDVEKFHYFGASIYVEEYEKLESAVEDVLQNKYTESFEAECKKIAELYNSFNDGEASNRIFEALTNISN